jgi:hypothetical protein
MQKLAVCTRKGLFSVHTGVLSWYYCLFTYDVVD